MKLKKAFQFALCAEVLAYAAVPDIRVMLVYGVIVFFAYMGLR
jgi:hypothetical protein